MTAVLPPRVVAAEPTPPPAVVAYTVAQVANLWSTSEDRIRALIRCGELRATNLGTAHSTRIQGSELDRYLSRDLPSTYRTFRDDPGWQARAEFVAEPQPAAVDLMAALKESLKQAKKARDEKARAETERT